MSEELPKLKDVTLEVIQFELGQMHSNLYPQKLDVEEYVDIRNQMIIRSISYSMMGRHIETKKYPETWWDAFKERWYPQFLKKRFPVRWDHFKLYNICPHINHKFQDDPSIHLQWIEMEKDFQVQEEEP